MAKCDALSQAGARAINACGQAFLASICLLAYGCAGDSGVERGLDRFASSMKYGLDGAVSESRLSELPVRGVVDIDIQTFAGDVIVRSEQKTDGMAVVNATVRAIHGHQRTEAGERALQNVAMTARISMEGDVPALEVRATSSDREPWLERTDIEILVPEFRRFTIQTRAGKVYLFGGSGGGSVQTTDGEIRLITPYALTENVTLITRGAPVVFRSFTGTCGLVDVDVVNGRVLSRVEAGDWRILDPRNDHNTLYAHLGSCTNRILMRTSDGNVIFSVVKNPLEHGSMFSDP